MQHLTEKETELLVETSTQDPNAPVRAVPYSNLYSSQSFQNPKSVEFFRKCIRVGAFPPACIGFSFDKGIMLIDGHHRATAWYLEGFIPPVKVTPVKL